MNETKIEWADYTWNPVVGCKTGCPYCYARDNFNRLHRSRHGFEFDDPHLLSERLDEPRRERKPPGLVFVCSMADLLGPWVPREWIEAVLEALRAAPWHTFALLTKFPLRYHEFAYPKNVWLGATATDQASAEKALAVLQYQDAWLTFLSCEPLKGPIRMGARYHGMEMPSWVIVGAETKKGRKPPELQPEWEWVQDLTRDAWAWGMKVWFKKNLLGYEDVAPKERPPLESVGRQLEMAL
jgi:protein gp37